MAVVKGRGSAAGHLAVVAIVLAVMAPAALAANHVVGGAQLWTYPPNNDLTYYTSTWAAGQTFVVGDTLRESLISFVWISSRRGVLLAF